MNEAELLIDIDPDNPPFKLTVTFTLYSEGDLRANDVRDEAGSPYYPDQSEWNEIYSQLNDITIDTTDWIVS